MRNFACVTVYVVAVLVTSVPAVLGANTVALQNPDSGLQNDAIYWDSNVFVRRESLLQVKDSSSENDVKDSSHVLGKLASHIKASLSLANMSASADDSNSNAKSEDVDADETNANTSYPRNLHRVYDGTWEIASSAHGLPFFSIPSPGNDVNSGYSSGSDSPDTEDSMSRNVSDSSLFKSFSHDMAFDKRSGFALLTAENHESSISEDINVVFGELLIRDGAYRSVHDVSLRLMGVYEWASGRLIVVGDVLYEDAPTALRRLYSSFAGQHQASELAAFAKRNITEEHFISALTPAYRNHRKQYRAQRGPGGSRRNSVAAQCPFTAVISIVAGSFVDKLPARPGFNSLPVFGSGAASTTTRTYLSSRSNIPSLSRGSHLVSHHFDTSKSGSVSHLSSSNLVRPPATSSSSSSSASSGESSSTFEDGSASQDELVEMNGVFTSDVCKTQLNLALSTLDTETLFGKAINYTLLVTFVAFMQVVVLIRQMEMTSTQAGASRVSLMTIGLQAVADSYLCLGHLTMGIAVPTLFNAFATAAFFKFIIFSIFEMRYMLLIWKARRPSGFSEGWEAMRRELSMLYSRFYGSLLFGIVLLYQMQNHLKYFMFALYSFWLPQIILSVAEDHRKPLHPLYILGMSVTRLAIPMYFWSCPHNFLHIQPQYGTALALVGWVFFQAIVLFSQYRYGPRWFVPKPLLPEKYDYFRRIGSGTACTDSDLEGDVICAENDEDAVVLAEEGRCFIPDVVECVICMTGVEVHSRDRMVTPCNHFFHNQCLEQWLNVKLECAVCRQPVPPP